MKHGRERAPAEQSAAPSVDEAAFAVFREQRELLKDIRDDLRWLRQKLEDANAFGK